MRVNLGREGDGVVGQRQKCLQGNIVWLRAAVMNSSCSDKR
jgi:hypothetical protein